MLKPSFRSIYFVTLLCFLLVGVFVRLHFWQSAEEQLKPYLGQSVLAQGAVEPASVRQQENFASAVVRVERLTSAGKQLAYHGRLRVSARAESFPRAGKVLLQGTLSELSALRNPGGFDSVAYNRVHNLGARLEQAQLLAVDNSVHWWQQLELINLALCARMEQAVGQKAGSILSSMLLGGSGNLDEETRELFTANGISHLLSVSGTHLLLLTSLLVTLLGALPKLWRNLLITALLVLYAALCGLRPPVLRALAMCAVLLFGGKGAERGRLLCLVAVGMLLCKPLWLQDIGFQLSFAAAAGLVWLLPACKRLVPTRLPAPLGEGLAVTLAAQLAVLPLEAAHFHQLSLISLVSNLILVPLLELAMQLALAGALLPCGDYLLGAAAFILEQAMTQGSWLAALPYSTLVIGTLPLYCWLVYYALLALLADFSWLQIFSNKERYVAFGLGLSIIFGTVLYQYQRTLPLTAYFLDVGQGDCAVVVTPRQKVLVIDTGGLRNLDTGSRVVAPFLRSLGYRKIDVLLLSHYDFDHVGGCTGLLRQMEVERLILPYELLTEASKTLQQEILVQARKNGVKKLEMAKSGAVVPLDAQAQLVIVETPEKLVSGNEASTLAAVCSQQGSVLFTGDMGLEREAQLAGVGRHTVLKAGHHGSCGSTGSDFLARVQPELAVFSCGRGNRYGHPHAETLERVRAAHSSVARTDELGCVKVIFDDGGIKCYSYVYNKNAF